MRILIVDDNPLDREMIRETVKDIDESFSVSEAENIETMFKRLKKPFDVLLLDISLDVSDSTNSAGLDALRELIGEYPDVPIAIVTGHFKDKVEEFLSYLGTSKQLIDYIDKTKLGEDRLQQTFQKAIDYRAEYRKSKYDDDRSKYYFEAFTGDNWRQRVVAESWIPDSNGACNINGMLVWIATEELIRNKVQFQKDEKVNISVLISQLRQKRILDYQTSENIFKAKFARDNFIHQKQNISKADALLMCDCYEILSS